MSRYARRTDPPIRPKQRISLKEGNVTLRLLIVGIALALAVAAFGFAINGLVSVNSGWQTVEAANPETGIAEQFSLAYNLGKNGVSATTEYKAVSGVYTDALEHAYRVLCNVEQERYVNLHTLNTHPNESVQADPVLYRALQLLQEQNCRLPFYAPVYDQYLSLYGCTDDAAAEKYDPEKSEAAGEFAKQVSAFAADPDCIRIELQEDSRVCLYVAPEYLAFAEEYGIESYVDLGILLNAFLADSTADALAEKGYTNGFITSVDGYSRVLCEIGMSLSLLDRADGKPVQLGTAEYGGPASVVTCRSFPLLEQDAALYYTYADGSIRGPYLASDGIVRSGAAFLAAFGEPGSVSTLAIQTLRVYASADFRTENITAENWIVCNNGQIQSHGDGIHIAESEKK